MPHKDEFMGDICNLPKIKRQLAMNSWFTCLIISYIGVVFKKFREKTMMKLGVAMAPQNFQE